MPRRRPRPSIEPCQWQRPRRENGHWHWWFYDATYGEHVHLIWRVDDEQYRRFFGRQFAMNVTPPGGHWRGYAVEYEHGHVIALSHKWTCDAKGHGVLAHECLHVVQNMLERRCVSDREAAAYLLGGIVSRCVRAIEAAA